MVKKNDSNNILWFTLENKMLREGGKINGTRKNKHVPEGVKTEFIALIIFRLFHVNKRLL